jgi:hypothetical protein
VLLCQRGSDHQGGRSRPLCVKIFATATTRVSVFDKSKENWQVVKAKRSRSCSAVQSDRVSRQQEERCSLYLKRMNVLCFNCLTQDHKVPFYHDPTRCWRCCQFGHTSSKCHLSSAQQSLSGLPDMNLGSAPTPTHNSRGTDTTIDDSILHIAHNSPITIDEWLSDLMLLEALLMNQRSNAGGAPPHHR